MNWLELAGRISLAVAVLGGVALVLGLFLVAAHSR
jgi:hypothetical protein